MPELTTPVATEKGDDPTALTTQQALREDMHLRDLMKANLQIITGRLDAMDKAIMLLQAYPTEVDRAVGQLKELHEEKFMSVSRLFLEKETAVSAAVQAAKEAVAKSETAFTKQIDQIIALIQVNSKIVDDKLSDMKDRLNRDEGRHAGISQGWGIIVSAVVVASAILGAVMVLI